ncbi:Pet127-domain-containing protein [Hypoxylon crocopeplum]|nr:Pet127-domain-containing protein [Hypoxylon crocopeplum]
MLQLSSRSVNRIGSSYVCAACFAVSQSARPLALHRHGRPLSSAARRAASTVTAKPNPNPNPPIPAVDKADEVKPPVKQQPKPPKKKKKKMKTEAKTETEAKTGAKTGTETKTKTSQVETERQLEVLQGALKALKNVLAAQNIDIDQIGKATSPTVVKTEANTKDKPESKTNVSKKGGRRSRLRASASLPKTPTKAHDKRREESPFSKTAIRDGLGKSKNDSIDHTRLFDLTPHPFSSDLRDYKTIGQPFTGEALPAEVKRAIIPKLKVKSSLAINKIHSQELALKPIETDHRLVPSLSYGLDRVLFNPGVYFLQDPRSRVFNFDPYLSKIMPIQEFDFNALKQYVTSSKDNNLIRIAKEYGKKYTGSTSSMTSMLSHFHYLLSSWREINTSMVSRSFTPDSVQFTRIMRGTAAVFLNWKDGTYAIDADKEYDTANILSMLGKSMEKLLTLPKEDYEKYRHANSGQITEEERNAEEAFHYTSFSDFMMRSQLDAHDSRVPGSGMFDLKTRAVVSIRMDAKDFHKGLGYEIRNRIGQWESFEREYYDMIRSAFLKYSLQVRMGRMDGIFVAFHNTQRIFGFQYIPLSEMDLALHGTSNTTLGHREFKVSLKLLNDIFDRATNKFPEQSLRMHFETRTSVSAPFMYIFAKPVSQDDIDEVQTASKKSIEAFENEILGIVKDDTEAESESVAAENDEVADEEEVVEESTLAQETSSLAAWKEVRQMVEDAVDDDEVGVGAVREAIEDALEQSGLLHARSSTDARGYVDALLGAITSSMSSKPVESSLGTPGEEVIVADEDGASSLSGESRKSESESSTGERSVSGNDSDIEESQIHEGLTKTSEVQNVDDEAKENDAVADNPVAQTDSVSGQDEHPLVDTDSSEDETRSFGEPVDNTEPERVLTAEANVEEKPTESVELGLEQATEEESSKGQETEIVEEEDDEEVDDVTNTASTMSPLKDLIVKMAQRIDERAVSDDADSPLNDLSKLKEFERILSELIARSKDEQTQSRTEDTSPTPDTQTEPETKRREEPADPETKEASETQDPSAQSPREAASQAPMSAEEEDDGELLCMVLTIKNKVNGKYVTRPGDLTRYDTWTVEYNVEEITGRRAQTLYQQCKMRRRKTFEDTGDKDNEWYRMFKGKLHARTKSGRRFRAIETEKAKRYPVYVMGQDKPRSWQDVFGKTQKEGGNDETDLDTLDHMQREDEDGKTQKWSGTVQTDGETLEHVENEDGDGDEDDLDFMVEDKDEKRD